MLTAQQKCIFHKQFKNFKSPSFQKYIQKSNEKMLFKFFFSFIKHQQIIIKCLFEHIMNNKQENRSNIIVFSIQKQNFFS